MLRYGGILKEASKNTGDHPYPSTGGELGNFCYAKRGFLIPFLRSKSLKFPSMEGCPEGGVV